MTFRRKGKEEHGWKTRVREHADLIAASGLPLLATSSEYRFVRLLEEGYLEDDLSFDVKQLSEGQKTALRELVKAWLSFQGYDLLFLIWSRLVFVSLLQRQSGKVLNPLTPTSSKTPPHSPTVD